MKKNNFGKYLSCSKCQREFSTRSSFEKHFQAHSKFTCENCGGKFNSNDFKKHQKIPCAR